MNEIHEACACLGTCQKWPFTCSGLPQWISVKSQLPKKWGMYLLCYYRENIKSLEIQVIHFDNKKNIFNTEYSDDEPKCWMPLPPLPKE